MGVFSEITYLKKALLISLAVHLFFAGAASFFPFFGRPIVYSAPLFVDLVKIPPPPAKKTKQKKEKSVVYKKQKTKKTRKKVKKKKPAKKTEKKVLKEKKTVPKKNAASLVQGKISVETAKFPFTYYLNIIQHKVTENWNVRRIEQTKKEVVVYFRIFKNGRISRTKIERSSKDAVFDRSALRAIALSVPLPPLPEEYEEDYLGIYFAFNLKQ